MVKRRSTSSKSYLHNPFITWTSTYAERRAHKPLIKRYTSKRVPVEAWLDYLVSPFTLSGRPKSVSIRESDLRTYRKFWRVANGSGLLKQFFEDPDLTYEQIARKMTEAGFKMDKMQVSNIMKRWVPKRLTRLDKSRRRARRIVAFVEKHPKTKWEDVSKRFEVNSADDIARRFGVRKPSPLIVSQKELNERRAWLERKGIEYPLDTS